MPVRKEKILFVVHEASRSGAPMILLGIIREFSRQSEIPFRILVMEDGPLLQEFRETGKTWLWFNIPRDGFLGKLGWAGKIFHKVLINLRGALILFRLRDTKTVLLNTISNGHIHKKLSFLDARFICYIHELEMAIRQHTNEQTMETLRNHTHLFLAGSEAVKGNLVRQHGLPEHLIHVVYSSLTEISRDKSHFHLEKKAFTREHHLTQEQVIIGIAGSAEWRKGFDLVFPLLSVYYSMFPDSKAVFAWKGYRPTSATQYSGRFDIDKMGLGERFILLPHGNNNIETLACFDIHLLLSREDPYPLVMLEAASFGIPTIAFKDTGGCMEFIEEDAGITVAYGDFEGMSRALHSLVTDSWLRKQMGHAAKEKLSVRHDQRKITAQLIDILSGKAEYVIPVTTPIKNNSVHALHL
jgi:glycosyltransferase involved in cell wall biosynthesis